MFFSKSPEKILGDADTSRAIRELIIRQGRKSLDQLSMADRKVRLLHMLQAEVLNGTIDQYLSNSSGDYFFETLAVLKEIDAQEVFGLLEEVASWFGEAGVPQNRDVRRQKLAELNEAPDYEKTVRDVTERLRKAFPAMFSTLAAHLRMRLDDFR